MHPTRRHPLGKANARRAGLTLVETMIALSVFTIIALGVSMTLLRGEDHRRQSFDRYRVLEVLRDFVAGVQETANLRQDLSAQEGIGALFSKYHGRSFAVTELPSARITVTCYGDETAVPSEFGGPQDLNFDGDPEDNLGDLGNGSDLKLVPMKITLTFDDGGVPQTEVLDRLITKTTD